MSILPKPWFFTRRSLIAGAGTACAIPFAPAFAAQAVGAVTQLVGQAFADRRTLDANGPVYLEEMVRTEVGSRLSMKLGATTTLKLGPDTRVRIDRFLVDAGGELTLERGSMLFDGKDGGFPKGLNVKSPYAVIAVRGTSFFAGELDTPLEVFVYRGAVAVTSGRRVMQLLQGDGVSLGQRGAGAPNVRVWGKPKIDRANAQFL
jgi:ferric-dicitrate binding protein FerR (iron transport regulator)